MLEKHTSVRGKNRKRRSNQSKCRLAWDMVWIKWIPAGGSEASNAFHFSGTTLIRYKELRLSCQQLRPELGRRVPYGPEILRKWLFERFLPLLNTGMEYYHGG